MANALFNSGREGFLGGDDDKIDWSADDIRVMLVRSTYTFDATDKFVSDLGAVDNGRSAALGSKTITDGVADADGTSLVATAAVECNALVIFKHTGNDETARLINYIDHKFRFTVSAGASGGATSISADALAKAIPSGAVATLISGTGPATMTMSSAASAGARSISVAALGSALSADAVYEVSTSEATGLPMTPAARQTVNIVWDNGANKIFKL